MEARQFLTPTRRERTDNSPKEPINVFCRVRPWPITSMECCVRVSSPNMVHLLSTSKRREMRYNFKEVFDERTSQKTVFNQVALPLIIDLLNGKNGLLFSYGVTGSGKTFTMSGNDSNPGIYPRAMEVIFNSIKDKQADKFIFKPDGKNGFKMQHERDAARERMKETRNESKPSQMKKENSSPDTTKIVELPDGFLYSVFISFLEIYNNEAIDLLGDNLTRQKKIIREDKENSTIYIQDIKEVEITTAKEAMEILMRVKKKKRVATTRLNPESSRGHLISTVRVICGPQFPDGYRRRAPVSIAQLSFVDLAGCERTKRTGNTGVRLKETGNINNSLMTLRRCLEILRENQATGSSKIIPYREAKITHLFKNVFEGDGRVAMIVCVNPAMEDYDENLNVLKFAERSCEVQITAPVVHLFSVETPGPSGIKCRRLADHIDHIDIHKEAISSTPKRKKTLALLHDLPDLPDPEHLGPSDMTTLSNLVTYFEKNIAKLANFIKEAEEQGTD